MLQDIFFTTALRFTENNALVVQLWKEIEEHYSTSARHYHTLTHLEHLHKELKETQSTVNEWDCMVFSLFYHDVIYDTFRQNNEEKSAAFAVKRLTALKVPTAIISRCSEQILATKKHETGYDTDTDLFTDADLAILGQSPARYDIYCQQIRKEYKLYPDFLYNSGRKKVLFHFLEMERIFKTDYFFARYEQTARENIDRELRKL